MHASQVGGGAELIGGFETACEQSGINLNELPWRRPKPNMRTARLNGMIRRAFWECDEGDSDLPPPSSLSATLRCL